MKSITTFDIILVPFPFSDLSSTKRRPCLVLKRFEVPRLGTYFVVCMVTSQLDGLKFLGDEPIQDWKEAGLPKPSLVRIGKLVTIEASMMDRRLGRLTPADQKALSKRFREFLAFS